MLYVTEQAIKRLTVSEVKPKLSQTGSHRQSDLEKVHCSHMKERPEDKVKYKQQTGLLQGTVIERLPWMQ